MLPSFYFKKMSLLVLIVVSGCKPTTIQDPSRAFSSSVTPSPAVNSSPVKILPTQSNPSPIFSSIHSVLQAKTKLPIRLPTYIPESDGPNPIYALLESATASNYEIVLAFTKDCTGGNACRLGGIAAEAITAKSPPHTGEAVSLANGILGYFTNATCGANCSDSTLTWEQNGVRYTVAIKAGKVTTLVKMANSAIASS